MYNNVEFLSVSLAMNGVQISLTAMLDDDKQLTNPQYRPCYHCDIEQQQSCTNNKFIML